MVVLSRESIHKVKTFDDVANIGIDIVKKYPIVIVIEIISKDSGFIAVVGSQPI